MVLILISISNWCARRYLVSEAFWHFVLCNFYLQLLGLLMLGLLGLLGRRTGCVAHRSVSVRVRIGLFLICSAPGFQGDVSHGIWGAGC
jgi:hypothetical protein